MHTSIPHLIAQHRETVLERSGIGIPYVQSYVTDFHSAIVEAKNVVVLEKLPGQFTVIWERPFDAKMTKILTEAMKDIPKVSMLEIDIWQVFTRVLEKELLIAGWESVRLTFENKSIYSGVGMVGQPTLVIYARYNEAVKGE